MIQIHKCFFFWYVSILSTHNVQPKAIDITKATKFINIDSQKADLSSKKRSMDFFISLYSSILIFNPL